MRRPSGPWYSVRVLAQRAVWPDRVRPLRRVEYEALVAQGLLEQLQRGVAARNAR